MIEGPRGAREDEVPGVIALANTVFYSNGKFDMGRGFPVLFSAGNAPNLRIFVDDGRPVAHAGFVPARVALEDMTLSVARVGAVCTLQEYQGKGLGTRLMDDLSRYAPSIGINTLLISGGRGLYRRMACIDAGVYRSVIVDQTSRLPQARATAARWTAADIPALSRLQDAEPVRYERDARTMATLVAADHLECKPASFWKIEERGTLAAYLCIQAPIDLDGRKVSRVRELVGSRAAALATLPQILGAIGAQSAAIKNPSGDEAMSSLIREYGLRVGPQGFDGTVKVVDRRGFFEEIRPRLVLRLLAEEARALTITAGPPTTFRLGSEELVVESDQDFAALAFGSIERASPRAGGALGAALGKVFPLPLPGYGLDYV